MLWRVSAEASETAFHSIEFLSGFTKMRIA